MEDANVQAAQLLTKANKSIRAQQGKCHERDGRKVAELAMDAASKILGEKNSTQHDLSLYDQFIKEAGDFDDGDGQ